MKTAIKSALVALAICSASTVASAHWYNKQDVQNNQFTQERPYPGCNPVLTNGSVTQTQQFLAGKGFYQGKIDGLWGNQTTAAIRDYQKSEGEMQTGMLTEKDLNKMGVTNAPGQPGWHCAGHGMHHHHHAVAYKMVNGKKVLIHDTGANNHNADKAVNQNTNSQ